MVKLRSFRWSLPFTLACAALAAAACGSRQPASPSSLSPATSPAPAAPAVSGGATITGTVVGVSSGSAIRTHGSNISVSVTGTAAVATVDDRGQFVLEHVPAGRVDLRFSGPTVDAHLELNDVAERASITITVRINGTTAQLDNATRDNPNHEAEIEGLVTSKSASTLTVNNRMIEVSAATRIVRGDTPMAFAAIAIGDRVEVKGTATGTSVLATRIEVQVQAAAPAPGRDEDHDDNDQGEDHDSSNRGPGGGDASAEVKGAIAGLGGTCPNLSFTVGGTAVRTNGSTQFKDTTCGALRSGTSVEVKGARQSDRSIVATRVEKK